MRPSMALRCPANSDNSPNNTSTRSPARTTGTSSDAVEDITPSSQPGPTNSGHPNPAGIRCQQAQPDRTPSAGFAMPGVLENFRRDTPAGLTQGKRLKQQSSSPSTPTRNASMREKPDGTDSPLMSLATRPLVRIPDSASSTSPAVSATVLPSGVVTSFDIFAVATPV